MKIRLLITICMGILTGTTVFGSSTLNMYSCSVGDRPFDGALEFINMNFRGEIEQTENCAAYITSGDDLIIEAASIEIENYQLGSGAVDACLSIIFNGEYLPLDDTYTVHLAAGSIRLKNSPDAMNEEISVSFEVPADLGDAEFDIYFNGDEIAGADSFQCTWGHEIMSLGEPIWTVYRNEVPVRSYTGYTDCDWDMGYSGFRFENYVRFEKGAEFSVRLPAGSVCGNRNDLLNDDVALTFRGGYNGTIEKPGISRSSLDDGVPAHLWDVTYVFDKPINVVPDQLLRLYESGSQEAMQTAIPTVEEDNGEWILHADFGGILMNQGTNYEIEMPEGVVVTREGDIAVNSRHITTVSPSGVRHETIMEPRVWLTGQELHITGISASDMIDVYTSSGLLIEHVTGSTGDLNVTLPVRGVYIIKAGKSTYKFITPSF